MHGDLFQRWHETVSYNLKEHEAVFLKRQNLFLFIVGGSSWFVFYFRLNIFRSKISILLLPLETEGNKGRESWYNLPEFCFFP